MDGLTMCGHMKEQGYRAPIFMLTTQTSPDLKAKAKDAGVVAWIIKPHKDNVLLDGIRKVLKL
jgi:two-component system chemotaxis response regulator CheY